MKKSKGRTARKRRRKHLQSFTDGVNCSHKLEYIKLKKWLKGRGFEDSNLRPAEFWDTGRGLMTTKALQAGDLIISLPEKCLVTTGTVLSSCVGEYIVKWKPPVSPLIALCTFLIVEKHAGAKSLWKPYFDVLPKTYTCPVCLEHEVVNLLPEPLRKKAQEQRATVHTLLRYFPPLDKQRNAKLSILKDHDFLENLTFGWDGPSWRLLTALKLLSLGADEFAFWKRTLLGDVISARNEQQTLNVTAKICHFLIKETQHTLLQISQLKRSKENLKNHLALVEALRLEDLKILQKSAEILCNLNMATT
ncbi:SET domain-containing protein 4 isoform X5 [Opisthocomus hoazin]|uniref:SET domain-containing protein 4 isoform X5 n=1 Tax=Opisthocomus hoazin TaxID=30419 RepID=UPI003F529ED4